MSVWSVAREAGRYLDKQRLLRAVGFALSAILLCSLTTAGPLSASIEESAPADINRDSNSDQHALPQVTVEARRRTIEHQAYDFVRQATRNPRYQDESLPRWNAPLCFAVAGLSTKEGQFALGRLAEIARGAGAAVAHGRCKYNFFVVFAAEPERMLKKAYQSHPRAFDRCHGTREMENFLSLSEPRPVRVWHNVRPFTRDGIPIGPPVDCGGAGFDYKDFTVVPQYEPSRIQRYDVIGFSLAIVIVDTAYPRTLKLGQLVDYAAMVGLADIAKDANLGDIPSILRIFEQPRDAQVSGLTHWDQAFLSALYHSDQATVTQRSQMAIKMSHDILP